MHQPVKLWLDQTTKLMHTVFQRSNTYRALHAMYEELGAFGTAASIILPDFDDVLHHYPLTVGEYAVATNWKGEVDTLYREFQKTVAETVREFGYDNCSPSLRRRYDNGKYDDWVTIIHAVEPRLERDASRRDALNMPWRSVYLEKGAGENEVLREGGFRRFPALCPRWTVSGGDIYGHSPGMEALGDIKQLQHEQLRKAQGIDYKTNPPLQVPTSLKYRDVDRLPGGIMYTDSAGSQAGIRPLYEVQLDLNHLLQDIQDVRGRIRSTFYADLFLMLSNQQNPKRPDLSRAVDFSATFTPITCCRASVRKSNGALPTPITSIWIGARLRKAAITKPAVAGPSGVRLPGYTSGRSNHIPCRRANTVSSLPPRATSTPRLSISGSLSKGFQRAIAASAHAVGTTCHGSSSIPALKSPFSICERSGSGSDCSVFT